MTVSDSDPQLELATATTGSVDSADSATADPAADADAPSFSAAMEELESILERIDNDQTDIDQLAEELRRAAELLELCRGKIRKAEVEVTQIVQKLGEGEATP